MALVLAFYSSLSKKISYHKPALKFGKVIKALLSKFDYTDGLNEL